MGPPRSTYYDAPLVAAGDAEIDRRSHPGHPPFH